MSRTIVHVMRHGEVHNPQGILYGRLPGYRLSERGRAQGLVWTFGRWGGAVAPPLVMALAYAVTLAGLPGWRGAFVLLGVLGVFWVIGFARWFRDTPGEHPAVNDAERRQWAAQAPVDSPVQRRPHQGPDRVFPEGDAALRAGPRHEVTGRAALAGHGGLSR